MQSLADDRHDRRRQHHNKSSFAVNTTDLGPRVLHRPNLPAPAPARPQAPSFRSFRSHLPLKGNAFALQDARHLSRASLTEPGSPRLTDRATRAASIDSPGLTQDKFHTPSGGLPRPTAQVASSDDRSSRNQPAHDRNDSIDSEIASTLPSSNYSSPQRSNPSGLAEHEHDRKQSHAQQQIRSIGGGEQGKRSEARNGDQMVHPAPTMTLQEQNGIKRTLTDDSLYAESTDSQPRRPKSPAGGRGLGTFFRWNNAPAKSIESSPTTTFSERSSSPLPSPGLIKPPSLEGTGRARLTPPGLDIQKANVAGTYFHDPKTPLLLGDGPNNVHVRELERELSHVSTELAESIRREMELEDELDRIRMEFPPNPHTDYGQRRSSDYFSDSGTSSSRYPVSDLDVKLEQVEKQLRKVEQEKANLKAETAKRLQTELSRRRDLEELVRDLEDQLEKKDEKAERAPTDKVDELMASLEEARRRFSQEKMTKENVEDLYSATRDELERLRNEADNLRDEVVPQLKARVEGLEGQAGDTQGLIYENTRLQQELAALQETIGNYSRFDSIQEEEVVASAIGHRMSLHKTPLPVRTSSLRRAGSVREGGRERSGSIGHLPMSEAVKEVEDQRDALHKALRLLIKRHEKQNRDHERAIRKLTIAKAHAEQISPKRTAYTREVAFLKEEVTTLRKRTEDALEQKWQYEKSLSGLKMDLDRAEQETRGLRIILQENDFTSPSTSTTEKDEQLKLSISRAESERDHARKVALSYRQRAASAPEGSESAIEFLECAERMDELAIQLESQVQAHKTLRARLSAAVAKGEKEQHESTRQIEEMQKRLAGMEDSVLAAQQHSETTLACHDAEVRRIEDASSPQLSRLNVAFPSPARLGIPPSPLLRTKSPKLLGGKMVDTSLLEMSRTQMLERKVKELEGLLREAEEDVKMVVQRVNRSQMEVADLQMERDEALNSMRKLQARMEEERERAEVLGMK